MLDVALLKRTPGLKGAPGQKEPTVETLSEELTVLMQLYSLLTFLLLYLLLHVSGLLTDALLHDGFAHTKVTQSRQSKAPLPLPYLAIAIK